MQPLWVRDAHAESLAVVTREGRLLVLGVNELPQLAKGKGNKIITLGDEKDAVTDMILLSAGQTLVLHAGKRTLSLREADLLLYRAERGRRGGLLPRGFQRVERLQVE